MLVLLIGLGLFLRLRQYVFDRSFWLDEARLANNVVERSLGDLLTLPLDWNQAAPPGFLVAVKSATWVLGESPKALRFVPLLAGVAALWVAWALGRAALRHGSARLCLVGAVCFAPMLVYYSSELKQYGSDATFVLLALWLGAIFRAERWKSGVVALALAGSVSLWCSHASAFVLAAVGTVLWVELASRRQWRALAGMTVAGAIWLVNLAAVRALAARTFAHSNFLLNFWSVGFAPWPFGSWTSLGWYLDSGLDLVYMAFGRIGIVHKAAIPGWYTPLNVSLLFLTLVGAGCLMRKSRRLFGFAALSIAFAVAASALHLYPFRSRLILFLAPVVYLALSSLIDWLAARSGRSWGIVAALGAAGVIAAEMAGSAAIAWRPYNGADIQGALAYVKAGHAPGDQIAPSAWSMPAYRFYARRYGLENLPVVATVTTNFDAKAFLETLSRTGACKRTWIILSERFRLRVTFLRALRGAAPQSDRWQGEGAGAYLFDFSKSDICGKVKR